MPVNTLLYWVFILATTRRINCLLQLKEDAEHRMDLLVGRTIIGFISDMWCVQLTTIGSTSEQTTATVYQILQLPVTTVTYNGCKGHVVISDTEMEVLKLFRNSKTSSENRLVILILNTITSILEQSHIFGEADVILVSVSKVYHLVMSGISSYFQEITNKVDVFPEKRTSLPDLMGRTLQVGTFSCPPFSFGAARNMSPLAKGDIDDGSLDGIEMLAFLELSKRLNFTWQINESSDNWGRFNNGTWTGGLLGGLASRNLDAAFCTLWIVEEQVAVMDYVVPWNQICNTFLVPRQGVTLTWRSILFTLDAAIWGMLGFSIIFTSLALCNLTHLRHLIFQPSVKPYKYERLDTSCLELVGMLALAYSPPPDSDLGPTRLVISSWFVLTLLVTTAYSCGLVSHLTAPSNNPPLDSVKDLVKAGLHWGHTYFPTVDIIFDKNNVWHEEFIRRFIILDNAEHSKMMKLGKHAVFGYTLERGTRYFLQTETIEMDDWQSMRVMKECMSRFFISLGLAKNSPYTAAFNEGLSRLIQAGIMEKWQRDVIMRRGNRNFSSVFDEDHNSIDSDGPLKLSLANMKGAFIVLSIGNTVATLAFAAEKVVNMLYRCAKRSHVGIFTKASLPDHKESP